jgi:YfiH family protein
MLEFAGVSWTVAFTERREGDLRVSSRMPGELLETVQGRVLELLEVATAAIPRQVHGAEVAIIERAARGYRVGIADGDGVATALQSVAVGVHVADCLPIAIASPTAVAMVHAGWRGLAAGVVGEGVAAVRALGGGRALEAVMGPGAGGCCYETGAELHSLFAGYRASRGRRLDLKEVARTQLYEAGVGTVHDVGLCTICAPSQRFFSHRRDGAQTGRQGGFAWLR